MASHNGAGRLPRTLEALANADHTGFAAEYIFVDNASSDQTSAVFESFSSEYPITVLHESRIGKSYALNLALESATGDYLAFIDDDIVVSSNWLREFLRAAREHKQCSVFTGQIRPQWSRDAPGWLQHLTDVGRAYGCTALSRKSGYQPYHQAKGGNLFIRRLAASGHRFDEGMVNYGAAGVKGGSEDTKFALTVLGSESGKIWYEREALVFHYIKPAEMSVESVLKRYVRIGEGRAARLEAMGQAHKASSALKTVLKAVKIVPHICAGRLGSAAAKATTAAMCYGEWRYMKRAAVCRGRHDVN